MSPLPGILASAFQSASGPQGAFDALATITVPSGGAASISFTGIPSDYKHLQVRFISRNTNTGYLATGATYVQFNNDTSDSYSFHLLRGDGANASAYGQGSAGSNLMYVGGSTGSGSSNTLIYGTGIIDILDYSSTAKNKVIRAFAGTDTNGAGLLDVNSGCYFSTSPITSIQFVSGTYAQNSQFALYGVK